jgi:uncharacterized protein (DUF885 family)
MSLRHVLIATVLLVLILVGSCGTPEPNATPVPPSAVAMAVVPSNTVAHPTAAPAPPTGTPAPRTATSVPSTDKPAPPTPTVPPPSAAPTSTVVQTAIDDVIARLQGLPLDQFFDASYRQLLLRKPEGLTYAGVSQEFGLRNDQLNNLSDAYIRDTEKLEDAILELLHTYDRAGLTLDQQVSYDVYEWYLDNQARGHEFIYCEYPLHYFLGSYDVELIRLFTEIHPLSNRQDLEDYVARLSQVDDQVGQLMEGLKLREKAGIIPPRFVIEWTLPNLQAVADSKAGSTPFYTSFSQKIGTLQGMSNADKQVFRTAVEAEITRSVIPAFRMLVDYFETLLPLATDDAGLWRLPNGEACYAYLLRRETSTDLTPDEIHALGLSEVARIQAEMRQAFDDLGYPKDASLGEMMERAINEGGFYDTRTQTGRDQAVAAYEALLAEMSERLTDVANLRPRGEIAVVGDLNGGGYYVPGSRDGSRPGAFHAYIGGPRLAKYGMATTVYHEAVPGHGFQGTIAQELDLPLFRTDVFFNGYAEGWALYSERLAWEMGMFADDPYGNVGGVERERRRAGPPVGGTGIHALRWTREEAKAYMNEALGDPSGRLSSEVERYVVLPAQATGYKIGMLKILELRQRAMDQLGDRFDLKEFHGVVLGNGMVPLEILEQLVDDFIRKGLDL